MRIGLVFLFLAAAPAATAGGTELDRWLEKDAIPWLVDQLETHPRFRGETMLFTVFADDAVAAVTNELALSLRDRLLEASLSGADPNLGWRQRSGPASSALDCTGGDVHYHVGVEIVQRFDGRYRVSIRALDLEDGGWVRGFGRTWTGRLDARERAAFEDVRTDRTFAGRRDVPWEEAETDLLAADLARRLACELFREPGARHVVASGRVAEDPLLRLVMHNLARYGAVDVVADDAQANASLDVTSHRVDGALHQYWVMLTPLDAAADDLPGTASASAYALQPGIRFARAAPPGTEASGMVPHVSGVSVPASAAAPVLGPLYLRPPADRTACGAGAQSALLGAPRCSLLAAEANADAIVFLLQYQANHGLVRLAGPECRARTAATLVTAGRTLELPVPVPSARDAEAKAVLEWQTAPGIDTYYAVALTDPRAARRLANHLDRLPLRCGTALRRGLEDDALERWLAVFASLAAESRGAIDWRAVAVRDVL